MFLRFFNSKFSEILKKTFFRQTLCHLFSFLKILKIRDSRFVAPLILRHIMQKIGPSLTIAGPGGVFRPPGEYLR